MLEAQPDRNGRVFLFMLYVHERVALPYLLRLQWTHVYRECSFVRFRPGLGGDAMATEGIDRLPVVHLVIW